MIKIQIIDFFNNVMPSNLAKVLHIEATLIKRVHEIQSNLPKGIFNGNIVKSLTILEDKRFFKHKGFDLVAIARCFIFNSFYRQRCGASTITQQLVRTILQKRERSFKRKAMEIYYAYKLEKHFDKLTILNIYLDIAYFGTGLIGLSKTSLEIFGKSSSSLNLEESFYLMSFLKYPRPKSNSLNWQRKVYQRCLYGKLRLLKHSNLHHIESFINNTQT